MRSSSDCSAVTVRMPARHGWPARLIRVLAELELVSLDRDLPALAIAGSAPTDARALAGLPGLRTAI